jgi:uncharacterized protein (TIGR03437 family)
MKLDPTGAVVWATYLGGTVSGPILGGNSWGGAAIAVDAAGDVYVAGITGASNFPTTAGSAFPSSNGGGFVVKLNPAGSKLIYGTYLGSSAIAMAVDSNGNAYVAGSGFPTTAGALQSSVPGGGGNVAELNPAGSALVYATYLGGSPSGIAVDSSGNAYITGQSNGDGVTVTPGALQSACASSNFGCAFIAKLNAAGSGLIYSTFLGENDAGTSIKVDSLGRAYILGKWACGSTSSSCPINSTDVPTTPGALEPAGTNLPEWAIPPTTAFNQFLASLSANGSSLVYSTYLIGAGALDVDASGDAYVAGAALQGFPVTSGAFDQCYDANSFAAEFSPAGVLVGATYFGPPSTTYSQYNQAEAIALGPNGLVSIGAGQGTGTSNFVANLLINNPLQTDGPCLSPIAENAASYVGYLFLPISPGELITLRGMGFGPATGVSAAPGTNGLLPTKLAGVQVLFNGVAAPLTYVQSQQINLQVPWELAQGIAQVAVVYNGTSTNEVSLAVESSEAGLFYLNDVSGQGAILNADGSANSTSNPAKPGDVIALFGTGGGPTSTPGVTGGNWPLNSNAVLTLPVTVEFGYMSDPSGGYGTVLYAGAAPGLLSAYFQINVRLPRSLAANPHQIVLVYLGQPEPTVGSNAYQVVTIAVQ